MLLKYLLVCARNRRFKVSLCSGGIDLNTVMGNGNGFMVCKGLLTKAFAKRCTVFWVG